MNSRQLIEQVVKTYATCSFYTDTGKATTRGAGHSTDISFRTTYKRPNYLSYEWSYDSNSDKKGVCLEFDGKRVQRTSMKNIEFSNKDDLVSALNSNFVDSNGLTGAILHLLDPRFYSSERRLEELSDIKVDFGEFQGEECSAVSGKHEAINDTKFWVRNRDCAILKLSCSMVLRGKNLSSFEAIFPNAIEKYGEELAEELRVKWKNQKSIDSLNFMESEFQNVLIK